MIAAQRRAVFLQTNVAEREQLEARLDEATGDFGDIGILVNNATPYGDGQLLRLEYTESARIEQLATVNYHAPLWAMQKLFPSVNAKSCGGH